MKTDPVTWLTEVTYYLVPFSSHKKYCFNSWTWDLRRYKKELTINEKEWREGWMGKQE
jgi:hypothetical protein